MPREQRASLGVHEKCHSAEQSHIRAVMMAPILRITWKTSAPWRGVFPWLEFKVYFPFFD